MSAPGGGFGEGPHGDDAHPSPGGGTGPEQPNWTPPWNPPAADYPPPAYGPPPGYGAPPYPPGPPQFGAQPSGYGPAPYPGGYYPAPDYQPAMQPGTNALAIASLISSFTGFLCCFIGSILAIVLGAIALNQIKQTRQDGYGLAVAGIVIGVGTLVVFLIIALFSMHSR